MNFLKQSTAVTVPIGPFVDATDGVTLEDGLTIQKADVLLNKNGAGYAAASADQGTSDAGAPYDVNGDYLIDLDATDTATLGRLKLSIIDAGAVPVWETYEVISARKWNELQGIVYNERGGRIWYVAASGGDDGNVGTKDSPLATAAEAITRSQFGDTILPLAGDYTEEISLVSNPGITLEGEGDSTHITTSAATPSIQLGHHCTVRKLKVTNSNASGYGVYATGKRHVTLEECLVTADWAPIWFSGASSDVKVLGVRAVSKKEGVEFDGDVQAIVDNCYFSNSGDIGDVGSGDAKSLFINNAGDNSGHVYVRNTTLNTATTIQRTNATCAVLVTAGSLTLESCTLRASVTEGTSTGDTRVIQVTSTGTTPLVAVTNCKFIEANAGSGTREDIFFSGTAGLVVAAGCTLDTSKVSDLTYLRFVDKDAKDTRTDAAAILVDTAELQTDWEDGGRLDLLVDATLADTADMQPKIGTPAADLAADIAALPDAAAVEAAADAALTAFDAVTSAELAALNVSGPFANTKPADAFIFEVSRRADGTTGSNRPCYLRSGLEQVVVAIKMDRLVGDTWLAGVSDSAASAGTTGTLAINNAAVNRTWVLIELDTTAAVDGEDHTLTAAVAPVIGQVLEIELPVKIRD